MSDKPIIDGGGTKEDQSARSMLESFETAPRLGARERVWSRLSTAEPRRLPKLIWLAPVAAAVLIALAVGRFETETPERSVTPTFPAGRLAAVEGQVELDGRPAHAAVDIVDGAQIETKPGASTQIELAGGSKIRAAENTALRLERMSPPLALALERGQLSVELVAASATPFVVRAGPWTLSALGRSFSVERLGEELIVDAAEARIRIEGPQSQQLEAGTRFDSRGVASALEPASIPTERAVAPTEPASIPVSIPAEARARASSPSPRSAQRPKAAPKRSSQQKLYDRAKRAHGKQAIRLFDRAAEIEGPLTELASYQAARLEMTAGRPAAALGRFEQLAIRFPRGTLVRETRLSALECKLELGRLSEARSDLEAYLTRYPHTERQSDLRFLRAELNRKLGDCEKAFVDYAQVRDGPRAADALYLTAWCADRLDKKQVAKLALGEYLRRFPSGPHAERARGYLAVGHWSDEKK